MIDLAGEGLQAPAQDLLIGSLSDWLTVATSVERGDVTPYSHAQAFYVAEQLALAGYANQALTLIDDFNIKSGKRGYVISEEIRAKALRIAGTALSKLGRRDDARAVWIELGELAKGEQSSDWSAAATYGIGVQDFYAGNYDDALARFRESFKSW